MPVLCVCVFVCHHCLPCQGTMYGVLLNPPVLYGCQYRQAIGLFNGAKFIKLSSGISISLLHLTFVITFIVLLLLLLCMDVERNPGPVLPKLSKLNIYAMLM